MPTGSARPGGARSGRSRCPSRGGGEVLVRTLRSGVSRGTETLVFRGGVAGQYADARAVPGGRLPGAGQVRLPERRRGRGRGRPSCGAARCSACSRTRRATWCPPRAVTAVPDGVPPARAVLAGTVETAVNALWDAGAAARRPGRRRRRRHGRLLRRAPARAASPACGSAGRRRRRRGPRSPPRSVSTSPCPDDAAGGRDLVVHASATAAGLQHSLGLLAPEGRCSS